MKTCGFSKMAREEARWVSLSSRSFFFFFCLRVVRARGMASRASVAFFCCSLRVATIFRRSFSSIFRVPGGPSSGLGFFCSASSSLRFTRYAGNAPKSSWTGEDPPLGRGVGVVLLLEEERVCLFLSRKSTFFSGVVSSSLRRREKSGRGAFLLTTGISHVVVVVSGTTRRSTGRGWSSLAFFLRYSWRASPTLTSKHRAFTAENSFRCDSRSGRSSVVVEVVVALISFTNFLFSFRKFREDDRRRPRFSSPNSSAPTCDESFVAGIFCAAGFEDNKKTALGRYYRTLLFFFR
mmetsp:Transcript_20416/g.65765  ORF Transcript_20416/g.65765 Transcript_20416/m.65765 type:complete len:293 (+) Transcript_20416:117-995(+)